MSKFCVAYSVLQVAPRDGQSYLVSNKCFWTGYWWFLRLSKKDEDTVRASTFASMSLSITPAVGVAPRAAPRLLVRSGHGKF